MNYLKLIRAGNLAFITLSLLLVKFGLFRNAGVTMYLDISHFLLLLLATLCIAAAGYTINDIYGQATDAQNKPGNVLIGTRIAEKKAFNLFLALNITGVSIGFYLANFIGHPGFSSIFILSSALLYLYSTHLKSIPLLGNILISILVALTLFLPGLFDLFPAITAHNRITQSAAFSILSKYAFFAFLVNAMRELIKDQEDYEGDKIAGITTFSVKMGRKAANLLIFVLGIFICLRIVFYMYMHLFQNTLAVIYALFFILGPLFFVVIPILGVKEKKDYSRLSSLLKLVLFTGLLSLAFYPI